MIRTITAVLVVAALSGCGSEAFSDDCGNQMDDLKSSHGSPQEITRYDSGDYHSHSWWYWSKGFSRTFVWQDGTIGSCETSDYSFRPL